MTNVLEGKHDYRQNRHDWHIQQPLDYAPDGASRLVSIGEHGAKLRVERHTTARSRGWGLLFGALLVGFVLGFVADRIVSEVKRGDFGSGAATDLRADDQLNAAPE